MNKHISHDDHDNLVFENLSISRMAGIRNGFGIEKFSPGINLIHGPNGIGKSRTAWALQSLIWPNLSTHGATILGNLGISGDAWNIELDGGKAAYQKNSAAVSTFAHTIPSEPHQSRYLLTLQDLLRVDNRNFAQEIQTEAAGGYDLGRVRSDLDIRTPTRSFRPSKRNTSLLEIQGNIRKLQREESALQDQEESINRLKFEREKAIAASHRLGELEAAKTYRNACDHLDAANIEVNSFPAPLAKMLGTEYQRAEELLQILHSVREEQRECELQLARQQKQLQSTGFSGKIPPKTIIRELQTRLESLQRQESELRQLETSITELAGQIAVHRNRLNQGLTEDQMANLDESGLRALGKLNRDWHEARIALHNQNDLAEWLGTTQQWDRESLKQGLELLSRYMRTGNSLDSGRQQLVVFFLASAAILIILEAVLLATSRSQGFLLFALPALPLFWLVLKTKSDDSDTELKQIRSQYSALDLENPTTWEPDDVFRKYTLLQNTAAKAELDHEREIRWGNLHNNREVAAERLQVINNQRESFTESYGIELSGSVPETLTLLANTLEDWRRETDQLNQAESRQLAFESNRDSILSQIRGDLQTYGLSTTIHDATSAAAAIEELDDRIDAANTASAELAHTSRRLEAELAPKISEHEKELVSIYEELGLELNDLHSLKALDQQLEAYQLAQNSLQDANVAVEIARSQLRQESRDEHLDHEAINTAISEMTDLADRRDELQAEISRITTEINQAQRQTRIEAEIAKEHVELELLSEGRDQDYASAADRLVFELVQNRNREVNRPPVFRIANDLFIAFTNGVYRLGLDEKSSEFTAIEADTGRAVMLDNLSSGTRVQLLLAVRFAFIEVSEQGTQLPLILDEALGNTDDSRARAIIDATIEIARRGRQVFYFTAQQDEIGKWSSALSSLETPLDWIEINLASIRGKASGPPTTDYQWDHSSFSTVNVPEGTDHATLFELLSVHSIDIRTGGVHEVDLWYLFTDASQLVDLRNRGIRRWGQYLNLHDGDHLRGVWNEHSHNRAVARARVIEELLNAWRLGRPIPVTIDDLNNSDQISGVFWDEVVRCAETHNWDGAALILALEQGEVSRFRQKNTEALSEWLRDNGLITDVKPLDDTTIRAQVISSMHDALQHDVITIDEIDDLLLGLVG